MEIYTALLTLGVLLLLVALIGQVKAQQLEVGTKNPFARVILGIMGIIFVYIALTRSIVLQTPPITQVPLTTQAPPATQVMPSDTPTMTPSNTPTATYTLTYTPTITITVTNTQVTPKLIEISQTQGQASSWFGDSPTYVSVGQGQSFTVEKKAIIKEIQIYLEVYQLGSSRTDQIICDLRNDSMVVIGSSSIPGFSTGGGWQSFQFNNQVNPGTYIFTCYLNNSYTLAEHNYTIGGNANDNSYLGGTRYSSTGGHPQDPSTWKQDVWDLKFKITMEVLD